MLCWTDCLHNKEIQILPQLIFESYAIPFKIPVRSFEELKKKKKKPTLNGEIKFHEQLNKLHI